MATRSPHVDSSVNERRLRPIYDLIDNGNNKKALQEAEKLLKKQKDFLCAKVLKALALLRLGKQNEAASVLQEVHAEAPMDDPTLQAMTICYRELYKPHLIAEAYEAASKKDPTSEDLLTHLFMAYVRVGNYKKQQQVAMSLYKLKNKNPYYFWAVMSIVMQAYKTDEKLAKTMLLPLAQRMTEKFIKDNKIEAEAEIQLYLMILELQGKYQEALEVMEGPLNYRLTSYLHYEYQKKAELKVKLKRFSEANSAYKNLIKEIPDQWSFYIEYFRIGFELVDSGWQPDKDSSDLDVDYTPKMMVDFVNFCVQNESTKISKALRGPYLARLELIRQLKLRNDPIAQELGNPVDLVVSYFQKFGDKGCIFTDIKDLLCVLEESEKSVVSDKVTELVCNNASKAPVIINDKELQRHVSCLQLCHYLGRNESLSTESKIEYTAKLRDHYYTTCSLGKDLLITDYRTNDQYSILAANFLYTIWHETCDTDVLYQLLVLLERTIQNSPYCHQAKLLLIKIYNSIGAAGASFTLYESLDIKHIQQDTLGYIVTRHLSAKGHFSAAYSVLNSAIKFFMANYKDTVDYLISSYKFGSFTKIHEFVKFRERLNNSLHYALVTVERMILDVVLEHNNHSSCENAVGAMEIDPENDKTVWSDLCDNRDFKVMISWEPPERQLTKEDIKTSFADEVLWLKYRNLIMRSIAAAVSLSLSAEVVRSQEHVTNGEKRSMADVLEDLLSQLMELRKDCKEKLGKKGKVVLQAPGPSRFLYYDVDIHTEAIIVLLRLILHLNSLLEQTSMDFGNTKADEGKHLKVAVVLEDEVSFLEKQIEASSALSPAQWETLLESTTNLAETLSFTAVLCGACQRILKPVRSALSKKGKRKKDSTATPTPAALNDFNAMISNLGSVANRLLQYVEKIESSIVLTSVTNLSIRDEGDAANIESDLVSHIKNKIERSYQHSLKEIGELLKKKSKYYASLRL